MKQVLIKRGQIIVEEVSKPHLSSKNILVQVVYSCISAGTEISSVKSSNESLHQKIKRKPENISKGLNFIKEKGFNYTIDYVKSKLNRTLNTGYSASGRVIEVGSEVTNFKVGDEVACAGSNYANHAEIIDVPQNLVVKIPKNVNFENASTVALGSISMQAVRRANLNFGEYLVVIGMGILGQISAQIATSAGYKVIAIDLDDRRLNIAKENGIKYVMNPSNCNIVSEIHNFTGGHGADSVIFAASTTANEPLSQAFQMVRKKGNLVLLGVSGMLINRDDMYEKELDFKISTSYGPGRYDSSYEEDGIDYPYQFVRWTENRNMSEYLNMISSGKISLKNLIEMKFDVSEASLAFQELNSQENKPLIVLLGYVKDSTVTTSQNSLINNKYEGKKSKGSLLNIAIIGAGSFAKEVHLPNLKKLNSLFNIYAIMSKTGANAKLIADQYNANYSTTDYQKILDDKNVDVVLICTRHNLHYEYIKKAITAGKAIFVEKPFAMNIDELEDLYNSLATNNIPFTIGYNRRYSKYIREIKSIIKDRINPMIINYKMNAGYIPLDSWVHGPEGGGRIIGEACHIIDLFHFLTNSEVENISVNSVNNTSSQYSFRDNVVVTISFKDGSLCTLTYTSLGNKNYPKEICEIFVDSKTIVLNDYKELTAYGVKIKKITNIFSDKGHYDGLKIYAKELLKNNNRIIPLKQLYDTSLVTFAIEEFYKKMK